MLVKACLRIPNTEVKPYNADGTRRATSRETRKSPNKTWLSHLTESFLLLKIKDRILHRKAYIDILIKENYEPVKQRLVILDTPCHENPFAR